PSASPATWARTVGSSQGIQDNAGGPLDVRAADVEMRDGAQSARPVRREPHAGRRELGRGGFGRNTVTLQIDHDDVRLRAGRPDGLAVGQKFGKSFRVLVILHNAIEIVIERIQSRRRENAGLPHPAAESFANLPGAGSSVLPESQTRADGATEGLGDAHHDRVGALREAGVTPAATAAFQSRAPSRCTARPALRATR